MVYKTLFRIFTILVVFGSIISVLIAFHANSNIGRSRLHLVSRKVATPDTIETLGQEKREGVLQELQERSRRLEKACRKINKLPKYKHPRGNMSDGNVHMCVVNKIGSMFLQRYFYHYRKVKQSIVSKQQGIKHMKSGLMDGKSRPYNIVFVRDPYTRLLSGYVEKLFSPNPFFWKRIGNAIVQRQHHRDSGDGTTCGSDVSFSELVNELIYRHNNDIHIDKHFQPLHGFCDFCNVHYDFIGKMETFVRDVTYLTDDILAINDDDDFKTFINESLLACSEEMMINDTKRVFGGRLESILKCNVTLKDALHRTWRRWQMRGFIETGFSFPENSSSSFLEFIFKSLEAHRASNKTTLAIQKRSFLKDAYKTLSLEQKLKLMEIFKPQFDMFGYDPMPDYVFAITD